MSISRAANLGFPRMGVNRDLKVALERFWSGKSDELALLNAAKRLRSTHWQLQQEAGIVTPPCNDFSLYDHVLDLSAMLGAVPKRFGCEAGPISLATYFAMARGSRDAIAMEMTKWFDTNYHYVVPEFEPGMQYCLRSTKVVDEYLEARSIGIATRPVLLGPVSFVLLGKITQPGVSRRDVVGAILPPYCELLGRLYTAGADWVQIDEPCLCLDLDASVEDMYREAYRALSCPTDRPNLMLTTYFGSVGPNLDLALSLGVEGLHLDLVRAPEQLDSVLTQLPRDFLLSLGIVDGRNVWRTNLRKALSLMEAAVGVLGRDRIQIAPSCSLLHVPIDLDVETKLDDEIGSWMAFAKQKLEEVAQLARAMDGTKPMRRECERNDVIMKSRRTSPMIHRPEVKRRMESIDASMESRQDTYAVRRELQHGALKLPLLPTTTIGSFPQTAEVRKMRASWRSGKVERGKYETFIEKEIKRCIRVQERLGMDVLVHGEFERNDMVEYFAEYLDGFGFTEHGWVQSYGSRCVKPPIIYGDVLRPKPMTARWSSFAQSLTRLPVKGMLTGPVTMLQWSFVRDDQPRSETCAQIALAIRDEVADLESAGIRIIQIDEPALREGLPIRRADWRDYLDWSIRAFHLASSCVRPSTQIHTHMCYSEFNDIMDSVAALDADVISIECSRSRMELLEAFHRSRYPNEIGPGVYDIHSPRIPTQSEIRVLLRKALEVLKPEQLWVNPDCGLKTRQWDEVESALKAMVEVASELRRALENPPAKTSTQKS
ncbi:MAG TPA: 5-methyltetrahydropteroyltriglutamate--homocysteine S-methyltransferase [Terracidiphilus sp.]|jgi:5-methyltetrahydropteroyltriglutamate--homocysteine methyltransferase